MKLSVTGSAYHSNVIAKFLSKSFVLSPFDSADIVYHIFGPGPSMKNWRFWLLDHRPLIVHWIGSDVLSFTQKASTSLKEMVKSLIRSAFLRRKSAKHCMLNLCGAPWLCEELKGFGLSSEFLPITALEEISEVAINNSKRDIDFLSYTPERRFSFYGGDMILSFARKNKDSSFVLLLPDVADESKFTLKSVPENVTLLSKRTFAEVQSLLLRTKCFLRITQHDGLSMSVLEALNSGSRVLWTYPFPFVVTTTTDSFETSAREAILKWSVNIEGHRYVSSNFSPDRVYEKLCRTIRAFAERSS